MQNHFLSSKHAKFPSKNVCPVARPNWQVWCRMIYKNVKWVTRCWQVVNNSAVIFRILICFSIHFLPWNKSLNCANHNQWPELEAKAEQSTDVTRVFNLFLFFYSFPVSGTFLKGKSSLRRWPKFKNFFGRHIKPIQRLILVTKLFFLLLLFFIYIYIWNSYMFYVIDIRSYAVIDFYLGFSCSLVYHVHVRASFIVSSLVLCV